MKIGLVGLPGSGKSSVFGALTGLEVRTGYGRGRAHLGAVKVPDPRVDVLAEIYQPRKKVYAETTFADLPGGAGPGLDRAALDAMRESDALCQVLRGFSDAAGAAADPLRELAELETETLLADLELVEQRTAKLAKERGDPREVELLRRVAGALESETPLRRVALSEEDRRLLSGFRLLTQKPLLLVLNVAEAEVATEPPRALADAAVERELGLVVLSAPVEMEIALLPEEEQPEFTASLGLAEPARDRFVRAAYALCELITMLTVGPDECRAWPLRRGTPAPRAAGKIHSDLERGFIRAEVVNWRDLVELGSEARCREAGKLRVEGKEYLVQDGDVVHFRFNV